MLSGAKKIRTLIVDDSASIRVVLRAILEADPAIEVVGVATDGLDACEKAQLLKPDIITMDVEMPRMDGIAALRQILPKVPGVKVIMLSSLTREGARTTFEALEAGAFDYAAKSSGIVFEREIVAKVKDAYRSRIRRQTAPTNIQPAISGLKKRTVSAIAIGASTGGPIAIQEVLSRIPANFPYGIFVAVHMPKGFTATFAERLNTRCPITVREAVEGDLLKPGVALIAPGGMHATVVKTGSGLAIKLEEAGSHNHGVFIPSIDLMISSMAEATSGAMLGIILTGMGSDGFKGMQVLKQKGGATLVQDEATSTIFGMPKACITGGVADAVMPLSDIGDEITRYCTR